MFKLMLLLVILLAAQCAPVGYPITTWQTVQDARQREAVMPLEWDSSLLPSVAERGQNLAGGMYELYGVKPSVSLSRFPDGRSLCEIMGKSYGFSDEGAIGRGWVGDYTARKCLIDPQYLHGAIAAYVGPDGSIYQVMWLTTE